MPTRTALVLGFLRLAYAHNLFVWGVVVAGATITAYTLTSGMLADLIVATGMTMVGGCALALLVPHLALRWAPRSGVPAKGGLYIPAAMRVHALQTAHILDSPVLATRLGAILHPLLPPQAYPLVVAFSPMAILVSGAQGQPFILPPDHALFPPLLTALARAVLDAHGHIAALAIPAQGFTFLLAHPPSAHARLAHAHAEQMP